MEKRLIPVILILQAATCAHATDLPDFPFICTAGEATIQVPPDIATISFSVTHSDPNLSKALDALQEESRNIVSIMRESGVAMDDAKASEVLKQEEYDQPADGRQPKMIGYYVARRFTWRVRNLDSCQRIRQSLLKLTYVDNLDSSFDVTGRQEREEELVQQAIANARQKANRMAKGVGARLGSIFALSESDFKYLGNDLLSPPTNKSERGVTGASSTGRADIGADHVIDAISKPPMITLHASIRVLYRMEPE